MRWSCLILFAVITLGSPQHADAEKVRTNQSTKVYSRPGEQATVLLKVESGQNMTLLEQEGRWLKVRVKGRTGYVPRSKVDMEGEEEEPKAKAKKSSKAVEEEEPKKKTKKVVEEEEEAPAPKKKVKEAKTKV